MVEVEELSVNTATPRQRQFKQLLSTLFRPAKTMREIALEERPVWVLPILLLSVLMIISALVAGPLRQIAAQNIPPELPESFQWMSPEQQEQYLQALQSQNGPVTTTLFPALGSLAGVWLGWFILGSVLHLVLTSFGSRSSNTTAYNLTAWASLPFAIRLIVQIVAMLATRQLINSPGLSGFVEAGSSQSLLYAQLVLRMLDIYLVWQFILLFIGTKATSGLTLGRSFTGVLVSVILLTLLSALPGFVAAQISALNVTQPFIFF